MEYEWHWKAARYFAFGNSFCARDNGHEDYEVPRGSGNWGRKCLACFRWSCSPHPGQVLWEDFVSGIVNS